MSALHLGISIQCSKASAICRLVYWPVSDVPEGHLGFPFGPFDLKGQSVIDRLILSIQLWDLHAAPTVWLTFGSFFTRLIWPTWKPLLMRPDTGVPVPALWVASRAISSAMVGIDPHYLLLVYYSQIGGRKIE